jgi:hypothetical protein
MAYEEGNIPAIKEAASLQSKSSECGLSLLFGIWAVWKFGKVGEMC